MLAKIYSAAVYGVDAYEVEIEVDGAGVPGQMGENSLVMNLGSRCRGRLGKSQPSQSAASAIGGRGVRSLSCLISGFVRAIIPR